MSEEAAFEGVMVLVLAVNETQSLRRTVLALEEILPPEDAKKIIIYYPPRVTAGCRAVIRELAARRFPIPVWPEPQASADNAQSLMQVFRKQKDVSHVMLWASDGEVAPEKAALLLRAAKENPQAFVKFSRMMKGGRQPAGKSLLLQARDRAFCLLARARLGANVTDALFFGHALFPLAPFGSYCLTEAGTGVIIEILGLFSRLGTQFIEFPVRAMRRAEAKSNITLKQKFHILSFLLCSGGAAKTREAAR